MAAQPPRPERKLEGAREQGHLVASQTTITARSGPLPPAEELLKYEQITPGCTERLLKMVENQSAHRIQIENLVIASQQKQSARGQVFGLIIGLTGILAGAALAYLGHDWVGGIIAGTTVTGLVSVFVIGQNQQSANLAGKKPR